jgi:hypothetical protein
MTERPAAIEEQGIPAEQFAEEERTVPTEQPVTKEEPMAEEQTATAGEFREQATRLTEQVREQAGRFPFFQPFAGLNAAWWSGAKQLATWYIDTSEKVARGVLDFQERTTNWAENTPWAPLFESQRILARRWIEGSTDMARRFWQLEEEAQKKVMEEAKQR